MPATRKKSSSLVRVISSKTAFRGPVFSVMTDEVEEPGNVRARRDVIRHSGSIVVLPLDDSGRMPLVLLERQYRYAAGRRMWELPAGRVDPGENHLAAAKRELMEETGYTASRWQKALFFYVSPGFLDESMTVYLASGLKKGMGIFTTIDFPGSTFTFVGGGNFEGDSVGEYNDAADVGHGFLLKRGVFTSFDFPGATNTAATGINPGGIIVGAYLDSLGNQHGFIRMP
ncbi:MAG TPA: NUDIX hydrolase [Candidatus Angelobacter sp.]|jgi:ADP-ribose pyrophosphatase